MHSLLKNQLKKAFGENPSLTKEMEAFVKMVDGSYVQFDEGLKQESHEQRQGSAQFKAAVDSATDIFYTCDDMGNFVYVNEFACKITGYSKQELLTMNYLDIVKPDYRRQIQHFYVSQRKNQEQVTYMEFPLLTKQGSEMWVGQNVQMIFEEGKITGFQAITRDVTSLKKAQDELINQKNFLDTIIDAIPSPVFVKNRSHQWVHVNDAYASLVGLKKDQIIGKTDKDFLSEKDAGYFINIDEEQFDARNETVREAIFTDPRNEAHTLLVKKSYFSNASGEFIVAVITDITQRKLAENQLQTLKEFYEQILNKIPTDIAVFDKSFRAVFINENAIKDSEKRNWIIGHTDWEYFEHFKKDMNLAKLRLDLLNQVSTTLQQVEFEEQFETPQGKKTWMLRRMFPILDEYGSLINVIGFGLDITQRKLAQEKNLKAQYELEEAQHIAKVGGWEIDVQTRAVTWTSEMYNIYELPTDYKPSIAEAYNFYTPETRQMVIENFKKAFDAHETFEVEAQITTKTGKVVDIRTKGVPEVVNGKLASIKGIFQDISLEKEAQRKVKEYMLELEKKNKELDQFAYIVSHDLKAPLRAINNLSLWIEEDLGETVEASTKENLDLMRKRVSRMENLINGVLQYSRAGRIKQEIAEFSLTDVLKEIISALEPPEKFTINLAENLPVMNTEKLTLEQVFSNYISNALKYNDNSQPLINISVKQNGRFYEFCVEDNGPGIEKEYHEKVFAIFQTLQARDSFESTGIGLSIVKKIVEEKGGQVWLDSDTGKGSRFYFSWPVNG